MDRIELIDELRLLEAEHAKLDEIAALLSTFCPRDHENRLCDGCDQRLISECTDIVANTFAVLGSLSKSHFEHEERIMKTACPPRECDDRFGGHFGDHAALSAELARLSQQASSVPPHAMIADLVALTRRWLVEHVGKFDSAMIQFVSESCDSHSRSRHPRSRHCRGATTGESPQPAK